MAPRTYIHQHSPVRLERRGFTLIEAALTTFIIGTAVLATVQLFAACTQQNSVAAQGTTAMLLASHIQETMAGLPVLDPSYANTYFGPEPGEVLRTYNDVDDFDGSSFNPPIDSTRTQIPQMAQYTQAVTVVPVLANKLTSNTNPACAGPAEIDLHRRGPGPGPDPLPADADLAPRRGPPGELAARCAALRPALPGNEVSLTDASGDGDRST